jgi:hypothetical protein
MDREEIIKFLQASMETEIDGSSAEVCDILFVIKIYKAQAPLCVFQSRTRLCIRHKH